MSRLTGPLYNNADRTFNFIPFNEKFTEKKPIEPNYEKYIEETYRKPVYYDPYISTFDKIFRKKKVQIKINEEKSKFENELNEWKQEQSSKALIVDENNNQKKIQYNNELDNYRNRKNNFKQKKEAHNAEVYILAQSYANQDIEGIEKSISQLLLANELTKKCDVEYNIETKTILIECELEDISDIDQTKEYSYVKSKSAIVPKVYAQNELNSIYDNYIYQKVFVMIYKIYNFDLEEHISAININGWVHNVSKETGNEQDICFLNIFIKKEDFEGLNLGNIEPVIAFRSLKGVAASTLSSITPVKPIMSINRNDSRFVKSYDVAHELDSSQNIAAMNWEDFENLVRELFEKEFSQNGGEVKITQASKDGGVDAIAFDPDPIRGGKIVIQAKRYTNTVGVSAVRDLYGTVLNEGANKGILVTTANYGADSVNFSKDKPLTLLNGSHLLHLLEKHGYKAKIDIKEAKKILSET